MTICAACQSLPPGLFSDFYSHHSAHYLHPSLASLLASASAGCKFCAFLQRQLDISSDNVLPQPSRVLLFSDDDGRMVCQIDEPHPRDVEFPMKLATTFHFAVPFSWNPMKGNIRSERFRPNSFEYECNCRPARDRASDGEPLEGKRDPIMDDSESENRIRIDLDESESEERIRIEPDKSESEERIQIELDEFMTLHKNCRPALPASDVVPFEGKRKPITGDTRSEETFRQIERWLDGCGTLHTTCRTALDRASDEEFLPTRLMDLQSMITSCDASAKLILAANLPSKHVNYVALSYGYSSTILQDQNFQMRETTEENVNQRLSSGIVADELPRTIREGIDIARRLKIRYVWDPTVCIIQDSPSDQMIERPLIPKIFAHAYFTIASSASANISEGYFRYSEKRSELDSALFSIPSSGTHKRIHASNVFAPSQSSDDRLSGATPSSEEESGLQVRVMKLQHCWGEMYNASPLNKCAWAMQEREFSTRILHFTETQVLWECRMFRASEGLPDSDVHHNEWPQFPPRLLDGLQEIEQFTANAHTKWLLKVADYTARGLEKAEDKFPALASMAQTFADLYLDDYIAGFWKKDIVRSLCWGCLTVGTSAVVKNTRHKTYVAPTWSWASVDGPVDFSYMRRFDHSEDGSLAPNDAESRQLVPTILGIHVPLITPADPFGPLKTGAELRLRGYMVSATLGYDRSYDYLGQEIFLYLKAGPSTLQEHNTGSAEDVGTLYFDVPSERAALNSREEVFVLYVHRWYCPSRQYRFKDGGIGFCAVGIALVRTGMGEREFKRVGHVRPLSVEVFEGTTEEEIVIV